MFSCTLLILTYKGKRHLEHLLPTVRKAMENAPFETEVLIVDNGCCEETREYVLANFPDFRYEFSETNAYLFSLNRFVAELENEFVFILNDDMMLHSNVLNATLPLMGQDPRLFAVTCNIMGWHGEYSTLGVGVLKYDKGWGRKEWQKNQDNAPRYTLYAGGGAAVFRTRVFNELGGFDDLFYPAYAEDLDLGHRAWQHGHRIIYNPVAMLYHREGATIKDQFKADELTRKIYRNQVLWMVKNGRAPGFLLTFILMLPYRLISGWKVDRNAWLALWQALPRLPGALLRRFGQPAPALAEQYIMATLGQKYDTCR